jgi:ATP-dependent DNA helicase PIF1
MLTDKQNEAFNCMKSGKNVFLTGPGGSGKSYLIKYFIDWYKEENHGSDDIFITSTTGLSSILINGITINRFSGIGTGNRDIDTLYKKIIKMNNIKKRWINIKVLIIDEISMMNGDVFDKLEILAKKIRKIDEPFGGIQIILSGDFLQLPPIKSDTFCYEACSWDMVIEHIFYFDKIVRQNDVKLQNILNNIRVGIITDDVKELLDGRLNQELESHDGIIPTLLFSKKSMVVDYNENELKKLIDRREIYYIYESQYKYNEKDRGNFDFLKDLLNSQYQVEDKLIFSKYSQVMLTVNLPEDNLANGSRGIIIDFSKDETEPYPIVLFLNGKSKKIKPYHYEIQESENTFIKEQIPLILSWAITIHKAQGMTLELVRTDIGNSIFEYGQVYVVLSRVKNINSLSLINIDYSKIKANPKVLQYYSTYY